MFSLIFLCIGLLPFTINILLYFIFRNKNENPVVNHSIDHELTVVLCYRNITQSIFDEKIKHIISHINKLNKFEIICIDDGSSSNIVNNQSFDNLFLLSLPEWKGKTAAQNLAITHARYDIILSLDFDTIITKNSIYEMLHFFKDSHVGVVSPVLRYYNSTESNHSFTVTSNFYWSTEIITRKFLSSCNLLLTAAGPAMMFRRIIWPASGLKLCHGDDCAIPLIACGNDYLVKQSSLKTCLLDKQYAPSRQFQARTRMAERNIAASLHYLSGISNKPKLLLSLIVHRLLRWFSPLFFISSILILIPELIFNQNIYCYFSLLFYISMILLYVVSSIVKSFVLLQFSFFVGCKNYFNNTVVDKY